MIRWVDIPEFKGQIIDVFEDFLDEKGIDIPSEEKEERENDGMVAIIYGSDYDRIADGIEGILEAWGVADKLRY